MRRIKPGSVTCKANSLPTVLLSLWPSHCFLLIAKKWPVRFSNLSLFCFFSSREKIRFSLHVDGFKQFLSLAELAEGEFIANAMALNPQTPPTQFPSMAALG